MRCVILAFLAIVKFTAYQALIMNAPPNRPLHAPGIPPAVVPQQGMPAGQTPLGPFPPSTTAGYGWGESMPFNPSSRIETGEGAQRHDRGRVNIGENQQARHAGGVRGNVHSDDYMNQIPSGTMSVGPGPEHQNLLQSASVSINRSSLEEYWHTMNPGGLMSSSLPSQGTNASWPRSIVDRERRFWMFCNETSHGRWANYIAEDFSGEMLSVLPSEVLVPSSTREGLLFVSEYPSSQAALSSAPGSM
jgi:hypothetical protein